MPRFVVLACVLSFAATGCDAVVQKAKRQVMPAPVLMDWDPVYRPFSDNEAHVRIRNTGDGGYVRITVTNAGREWNHRTYFNAGEERTEYIVLKGCTNFSGGKAYCKVLAD